MAYLLAIRRLVIFVVPAKLVEIVFVELSHKAGEVAVLKMLREDLVGELVRLCIIMSAT